MLSGGRLTAGAGVGVIREEFDALGVEYHTRGARTDEALRVLKVLWTTRRPSFAGRFHRFAGPAFSPAPVQRPHRPIWIGGSSGAAMRRAATLGDGWHRGRPRRPGAHGVGSLRPGDTGHRSESGRQSRLQHVPGQPVPAARDTGTDHRDGRRVARFRRRAPRPRGQHRRPEPGNRSIGTFAAEIAPEFG
ncbi:LLM class flavin-dependent oxidoreductase [Streptomyces sp. MN03-5084-2B]|nr:LLM class flavin-dependent oxidoreductase [Streptomyces sp. MN03-5084-2B]